MSSFLSRSPLGGRSLSTPLESTSSPYGHRALPPLDDPTARRREFSRLLHEGECFLFDGATATLLYERGIYINRSFDEVNLLNPDLVAESHREYIQAGAQVITTNTWGANARKLKSYALEAKVADINLAGARIARSMAGRDVWVAGCLGPLGVRIEPWGPTSFEEAQGIFLEQARSLVEGGVDLFVLESFADLNEIHQAIRAVRELGEFPIVAQMATNDEGQSLYGTEPEWFVRKLDEWGADAVGINGGNGPAPALELLKRLKSSTNKP
jgi:homocysteine S-methyltransferase